MNLFISKYIPAKVKNELLKYKDYRNLNKLSSINFDADNLHQVKNDNWLNEIFRDKNLECKWNRVKDELQDLHLPENTGGVNTGDQKAILFLIWYFKPVKILEIGTHIGCSTVHIAIAMRELGIEIPDSSLTTVDIRDVNDEVSKPWVSFKSSLSPLALVRKIKMEERVSFVSSPSVEFMKNCEEKFDFIFLDGGHSADLVYQELPLAVKLLNPNGIILLHDYFPENKPIWNNNLIIPGPYLATERLIKEGNGIRIMPLGELPWSTKQNSRFTSLAVCIQA